MKQGVVERKRGRRPAVAAWLHLARVFQRIDKASTEQFRRRGLSPAWFDVLAHVDAAEGAKQQDLADALYVTKGNVCQLLDRLAEAGLLVRRPEGRSNRIFLTDEGRRALAEAVPGHEALIAAELGALTAEEQRHLAALLRRIDRKPPAVPPGVSEIDLGRDLKRPG
jgi:DNA-binding MarR family transcriptional regulator